MPPTIRQRLAGMIPRALGRTGGESRALDGAFVDRIIRGEIHGQAGAIAVVAGMSCINVLSSDIGALSCKLLRKTKSGRREEVTQADAAELLRINEVVNESPNEDMGAYNYRQAAFGHVFGWGNHFAAIERDGFLNATGLRMLSAKTEPKRDKAGHLYFQEPGGRSYDASDVLHLRGMSYDGIRGYSPTHLHRQTFELADIYEKFGLKLFENDARPRGVLTTEAKLSPEEQEQYRVYWEAIHRGPRNAGRIAILGSGAKYTNTTLSPEDAQYLALRQFQLLEICRIYRVPPNKVMDFSSQNRATMEEANASYFQDSIIPWLTQFEQEANRKLLTRAQRAAGLYIEFNANSYLRGNMAARSQFYRELFMIGGISIEQINRLENIEAPETEAAKSRFVPLNMVPLEKALEVASRPQPGAAARGTRNRYRHRRPEPAAAGAAG